ncbi:3',5'-cyclic-nucleotide phosphodiesterase pde1 [Collariella sp. IMI 366227]|nr:3',5'-cyclic-nucleotide phosphodiesterase pde1 [Collariella sp. IMI 366227]
MSQNEGNPFDMPVADDDMINWIAGLDNTADPLPENNDFSQFVNWDTLGDDGQAAGYLMPEFKGMDNGPQLFDATNAGQQAAPQLAFAAIDNEGFYTLENAQQHDPMNLLAGQDYPLNPLTACDTAANQTGQYQQVMAAGQGAEMGQGTQTDLSAAGQNISDLNVLMGQLQGLFPNPDLGQGLNANVPVTAPVQPQGAAQTSPFAQPQQLNPQARINPPVQSQGDPEPKVIRAQPRAADVDPATQIDKLSHTRGQRFDPNNEPAKFYVNPTGLVAWGPQTGGNQPRRLFEYHKSTAELIPSAFFNRVELVRFFLGQGHPNPNRKLTLWIQNVPAQMNYRYPNQASSSKCRYKHCQASSRTILKGWYRVAFDEFSDKTGHTLDPFHNAGYMHLHCFEALFDLGYLLHHSASRHGFVIRPDTRNLAHEMRNPAALTRDHETMWNAFQDWKHSHQERADRIEAQNNSLPAGQPYTGFNPQTVPPHDQRLGFALTEMHLSHQVAVRQVTRDRRGGAHIGLHKGDLVRFNQLKRREQRKRQGFSSDSDAEREEEEKVQAPDNSGSDTDIYSASPQQQPRALPTAQPKKTLRPPRGGLVPPDNSPFLRSSAQPDRPCRPILGPRTRKRAREEEQQQQEQLQKRQRLHRSPPQQQQQQQQQQQPLFQLTPATNPLSSIDYWGNLQYDLRNVTAFLVRSIASGWAKGSVVAVDAGVHLSAIKGILGETQPARLGEEKGPQLPHTLETGPFAGLQLPSATADANAAHIHKDLIETYLITHPHLDHIAGFVINTAGLPGSRPKRVAGLPSTITALKTHVFNNVIWPNLSDENNGAGLVTFTRLVEGGSPALGEGEGRGYLEICNGLAVKIWSVSHGHCIERHSHRGSSSTRHGSFDASALPMQGMPSPSRNLAQHTSLPTNIGAILQQHERMQSSPGGRRGSSFSGAGQSIDDSVCVYDSSAYFIRDVTTGREILMFGDVEPDSVSLSPRNRQVWEEAAPKIASGNLTGIFIECSYDDSRCVERLFGHLTPRYISEEMTALAEEVIAARQEKTTPNYSDKKRKRVGEPDTGSLPKRKSTPQLTASRDHRVPDHPLSPKVSTPAAASVPQPALSRTTATTATTSTTCPRPSPAHPPLRSAISQGDDDDDDGLSLGSPRIQVSVPDADPLSSYHSDGLKVVIIHVKESMVDGVKAGM